MMDSRPCDSSSAHAARQQLLLLDEFCKVDLLISPAHFFRVTNEALATADSKSGSGVLDVYWGNWTSSTHRATAASYMTLPDPVPEARQTLENGIFRQSTSRFSHQEG